ncbi:MAG: hypothetical protein AB8C46_18790 [Burkholderiaceae bacterium]
MPYKIALSLIVLVLGGAVAAWEFFGSQAYLGWVVAAIMAVMLLGLWVFPEAGGGKPAANGATSNEKNGQAS